MQLKTATALSVTHPRDIPTGLRHRTTLATSARSRHPLGARREAQHRIRLLRTLSPELRARQQPCVVLVRAGVLLASARDYQFHISSGQALVLDGREPFTLQLAEGMGGDLLVFEPDPRCLVAPVMRGPERSLLLPMVHEPASEFAALLCRLADALDRTATLSLDGARPAQFWLDALIAAQSQYQGAIDRCHGRTTERRRDLFVRLSRARTALASERGGDGDIDQIAEIARLSPSHFVRLFHKVFGEPPHSFRLRRRMESAHRLIQSTPLSIQEVMWRVGFDNHSCFARAFRRHFGCSASALRDAVSRPAEVGS